MKVKWNFQRGEGRVRVLEKKPFHGRVSRATQFEGNIHLG